MPKEYLGDGLYMEYKGKFEIVVTSEDGINILDRVIFDRDMVKQFAKWVEEQP